MTPSHQLRSDSITAIPTVRLRYPIIRLFRQLQTSISTSRISEFRAGHRHDRQYPGVIKRRRRRRRRELPTRRVCCVKNAHKLHTAPSLAAQTLLIVIPRRARSDVVVAINAVTSAALLHHNTARPAVVGGWWCDTQIGAIRTSS